MASAAIVSLLRRRRSPSVEAFVAPVDLTKVALVETLALVSAKLIALFLGRALPFKRKNSRSLLHNHSISSHFHDFNQEISTLLDVFPLNELNLSDDIREQIELLQKQSRKSKLLIDKHDKT
ncbi:U-box domain-containing protein 17 [Camellia lanceoleosa]|uniref:U-box domain-containing protein 17 n=1 Tax=Camellia lanceoleosa TaxID=1840588 RepID=A0ACC0GLQ1_9ERIC|nr:U-box domain-containing protein 17 [Camellia lanceoleosa]